ncbi:hypothetical protein Patl1_11544 [Pistacia atlantica]|uniref:Uncharacterized protein n=1 Tax=Pistacia atlantica TaxID=434234 RepID=A0ACC1A8A6_9ROSI|nr:hypothetical protein Patl1_11544 [Pistacia atlantica]
MRFLLQNRLSFFMGSLRTSTAPTVTLRFPSNTRFLQSSSRVLSVCASKPINNSSNNHRSLTLKTTTKTNDFSSVPENRRLGSRPLDILKIKLKELGIYLGKCVPGQYTHMTCPACNGGDSEEKSLSVYISPDGYAIYTFLRCNFFFSVLNRSPLTSVFLFRNFCVIRVIALWICFRTKCGWKGSTRAFGESRSSLKQIAQTKTVREVTVEGLKLEPLSDQLRGYFAERMITSDTLQRNRVMQKRCGDNEIAIAFTYWKKEKLVNCKYRDIMKRFWQEKDTEKVFYGFDDIEGESDIIIVEGEMDKLSMEEAGFRNCVSVPDGAPAQVSTKDLPPEDKDTKYQYLWNCKEYLKKASRIILATDGDRPGQALAEELARRLGKERCWRVKWPKSYELNHFKDANEVLMYLGPQVLKEVIENAELYPISGLYNFRDYFDEIDAYYYQQPRLVRVNLPCSSLHSVASLFPLACG